MAMGEDIITLDMNSGDQGDILMSHTSGSVKSTTIVTHAQGTTVLTLRAMTLVLLVEMIITHIYLALMNMFVEAMHRVVPKVGTKGGTKDWLNPTVLMQVQVITLTITLFLFSAYRNAFQNKCKKLWLQSTFPIKLNRDW